MMTGYILNQHIIIRVPVRFPDGSYREVEFLLDSGFSGSMVLPSRDIATLQLPQALDTRANLADGSEILVPTYEAALLWHGVQRNVIVLATGDRPLIGTALLQGSALYAEFVDNGKVILNKVA